MTTALEDLKQGVEKQITDTEKLKADKRQLVDQIVAQMQQLEQRRLLELRGIDFLDGKLEALREELKKYEEAMKPKPAETPVNEKK